MGHQFTQFQRDLVDGQWREVVVTMRNHQCAELAGGRQRAANRVIKQRNNEKAGNQRGQKNRRGNLVFDLAAFFFGLGHHHPYGFIAGGGLYALGDHTQCQAAAPARVVKELGLFVGSGFDLGNVQMHIAHELATAGRVHRVVAQRQGVKDQRVCGLLAGDKAGHTVIPAQLGRQCLCIIGQQAVKRGIGAAPCQQIGGAGGQHSASHP